ncbi:hypothetical protein Dxin01_00811 [Deinococcus xinjiangensis]|uniref:PRTRC system protein B n=1 Tax=Deinococcus xinjiangensis TaxID=457454 RepID=A0ABP9VA74_9DEIO
MDVELHIDTGREFLPHAAILVYRDPQNGECHAEFHRAFLHEQQFHVAEAHPLTTGDIKDLVQALGAVSLQFTPEHVVAVSPHALAWWCPAQTRTMYFLSNTDKAVNALSGLPFPQPALLFIATQRQLRVYALSENVRPSPETPLMCAPYFNIFKEHGVCQGSTPYPHHLDALQTAAWEQAFFGSNFTHNAAGVRKITAFEGSHAELWQAAAQAGEFRTAWLTSAEKTLEEALK